jgi:hypothetical protein
VSKRSSPRSSKKIKKEEKEESDSDRSDKGENSAGETYFKVKILLNNTISLFSFF